MLYQRRRAEVRMNGRLRGEALFIERE